MAADTFDVVTAAEVTPFLSFSSAPTTLEAAITAVSRRLDEACGAIVTRGEVTEYHDGGHGTVRLKHPASAFTSVTEYQGSSAVTLTRETVGTEPADGYYAEPHAPDRTLFSGRLVRRSGGKDYGFYAGRGNVAVVYTAGRYADTASVDRRFKEAALIMLRNLVGASEPTTVTLDEFDTPGGRYPTFAVPNAVRQLLWDEWREIPGVG